MLSEGRTVVAPGVFDGLSARLVEQAGFGAVYATGSAIARSCGLPDLGLLSMKEVVDRAAQIADVVDVPLIFDADDGYGNVLNAQRSVRALERAGVAGCHLEDQVSPKRSGRFLAKRLVTTAEMVGKLQGVRDALDDADFLLIARTDALPVEGFEAALDRLAAYKEAGADALYLDFPSSEAQMEELIRRFGGWHMALSVEGSPMPFVSVPRLAEMGFQIILVPTELQRVCMRGMQDALQVLARDGGSGAILDRMVGFQEREMIVGIEDYVRRYDAYGGSQEHARDEGSRGG
jgi:2-methylisocitrate lyase-like PEP mutase family enzyme